MSHYISAAGLRSSNSGCVASCPPRRFQALCLSARFERGGVQGQTSPAPLHRGSTLEDVQDPLRTAAPSWHRTPQGHGGGAAGEALLCYRVRHLAKRPPRNRAGLLPVSCSLAWPLPEKAAARARLTRPWTAPSTNATKIVTILASRSISGCVWKLSR